MTLAGVIETVTNRHAMQDDGVNYLDLGDAILRHDWKIAANGVWSPLYPVLQAAVLRIVKPSAYSQFTVVHCVNFCIFLFTLACFEFLWSSAVMWRAKSDEYATSSSPHWAIFAVGYAIFFWTTFTLLTLRLVAPDMLMASFVYLAAGLLLRISDDHEKLWRFLLLGCALGLGYLAKAPVFPLAFVFFALAWFLSEHRRQAAFGVLSAIAVFLAIGALWFVPLSLAKGHLTIGESGKFNYVVHVNDVNENWSFQDLGTAGGQYVHRVLKVFDDPPVYGYLRPVHATSALSFDPSYWAEGAVPRVRLSREFATVRHWCQYYLQNFYSAQMGLFVGLVVLCFMAGPKGTFRRVTARWPIWLIGVFGLALYALVYVELRYVAVFFCVIWVGLFSGATAWPFRTGPRTVAAVAMAVLVVTAAPSVASVFTDLRQLRSGSDHKFWRIAQDLQALGVRPGDRVARLPGHYGLTWGRLLGTTEVARTPPDKVKDFWCAKAESRAEAMEAVRQLSVTVFVVEQPPPAACPAGPEWHRIGEGTYYALMLRPEDDVKR